MAGGRHADGAGRLSPGGRPALTSPRAWAQAALDEIERAGVRALSVQAVARSLGVSKGGLYHHFAGRPALLAAALELWEEQRVTETAARFDAVADPRERLHGLLVHATVELRPTVILQLMAAPHEPLVAAALERSSAARVAVLERTFLALGAGPELAGHRAVIAYSQYLGLAQLRAHAPHVLATPEAVEAHVAAVEAVLLAELG